MTTRQTFFALLLIGFVAGCASPNVMQPHAASLRGDAASAKRCVGNDVCFVYRQE